LGPACAVGLILVAVAMTARAGAVGPPVDTTPPSVTGAAQAGSSVTCAPGQWDSPGQLAYSYQWLDDGQASGPATQTWALGAGLVGHQIACRVTAALVASHFATSATSPAVTVAAQAVANTALPAISGTPSPGQTLSCSQGSWSPQPVVFTYQWRRDGARIAGASAAGYTVVAADAGHVLSCAVSVALTSGGLGSAASAGVSIAPGSPVLVPPVMAGAPTDGQGGPPGAAVVVENAQRPVFPARFKPALVDPYIQGIEVTQGTQTDNLTLPGAGLPYESQLASGLPAPSNPYSGVELAAGQPTVVRVFVANRLPGAVLGASVALAVLRAGALVGTLSPQSTPAVGSQPLGYVTPAERANPAGAWDFVVPPAWAAAGSSLTLRASVTPPKNGLQTECANPGCRSDDSFSLTDVGPFVAVGRVEVDTFSEGPPTFRPAAVDSVFAAVRALYPDAGAWLIHAPFFHIDTTWIDDLAVTDAATQTYCGFTYDPKNPSVAAGLLQQCQINQYMVQVVNLEAIAKDLGEHIGDVSVGIFHNTALRSWAVENGPLSVGGADTNVAAVDESQPISSVGHEIGHALGLVHSDTSCGGGGVPVPATNVTGQLTGYSFEDAGTLRVGRLPAPPRYVVQTPTDYDLMSYCGSPATDWISPSNWNQTLNTLQSFGAAAAARRARLRAASVMSPELPVTAVLSPGGASSVDVGPPVSAYPSPAASAATEWTLTASGPSGASLGTFAVSPEVIRVDHDLADPRIVLSGFVPVGARSVSVLQNGSPVATLARAAVAPTASLLTPRAGRQRLGAPLRVRWRAADAGRALTLASIDVSADGGRSWRPVASGLRGTSTTIPAAALPASGDGRLRVRVSDGFDVASSVSGRLRFAGAVPSVTIEHVAPADRIASDEAILLSGVAIADGGTGGALSGGALTWRDGRRAVGHGTSLELRGLTPGSHELSLSARDAAGHSGVARVRIRVTAAAPVVTAISSPAVVAGGTRSIAVRIATDEPARLGYGGHGYAVGLAGRTVRLRLPRAGTVLGLKLTLSAYGRTSTRLVVVSRGAGAAPARASGP
jgi:hypothetical protein